MAELAIATGIIQVAGAGVALTKALYNFGATTSSAGEQTDFIGKNITLYCRVLKTLGQQLKVKEPDHTEEALDLASEIHEQSHSLFQKIWKLLPTADRDGSGLSFKQRILWNFRRSRVDYLVGQLEYLKSTVSLLLHILASVPKLRKYRRSKKKSQHDKEQLGTRLNEVQNLIYERCQAQRQLPVLAERANRDSVPSIAPATSIALSVLHQDESSQALTKSTGPTLAQIDAYTSGLSAGSGRTLVLQKTSLWLAQLYEHWTTLSEDSEGHRNDVFSAGDVTDLTASTAHLEEGDQSGLPNNRAAANEQTATGDSTGEQAHRTGRITFKYQPHRSLGNDGCQCVEATLGHHQIFDELEDLSKEMDSLVDGSCRTSKDLTKTSETMLKLAKRRKDIQDTTDMRHMMPLFRARRGKLSELLAHTEVEIAGLCQQRVEAMASDDWEKVDTIKQKDLPPRLARRHALIGSLAMQDSASCFRNGIGSLTVAPIYCDWDVRYKDRDSQDNGNHSERVSANNVNAQQSPTSPDRRRSDANRSSVQQGRSRRNLKTPRAPSRKKQNDEGISSEENGIGDLNDILPRSVPAGGAYRRQANQEISVYVESGSDYSSGDSWALRQISKGRSRSSRKSRALPYDPYLSDLAWAAPSTAFTEVIDDGRVPAREPEPAAKLEDPLADGVDPDPFGQARFWDGSGKLQNDGHQFTTSEDLKARHERFPWV